MEKTQSINIEGVNFSGLTMKQIAVLEELKERSHVEPLTDSFLNGKEK